MIPLLALLLALLALAQAQLTPCYSTCKQGDCLAADLLACTACDPGSTIFANTCVPVGGQSEPIRFVPAITQNILRNDFPAFRQQINCQHNLAGNLTYLNITVSKRSVYVLDPVAVPLPIAHQYIQVKFNAILFNQKPNPQIQILIIDDQDRNLYFDNVEPSPTSPQFLSCLDNQAQTAVPSSRPFYVSLKFQSSSSIIYIQIGTLAPGDELGISNLLIYSGNCNIRCATCNGPTQLDCLSCASLLFFNATSRTCNTCPAGFTLVNDLCFACPYNCQTCNYNVSAGQFICLTCLPGLAGSSPPTCAYNGSVIRSATGLNFNDADGWQSSTVTSGLVTQCGPYSLIGGVPVGFGGSTFTKTFTGLLAHETIWIKFTLLLIDQSPGNFYTANVYVDGTLFIQNIEIDQNLQNSNTCAGSSQEYVKSVYLPNINHRLSNVTVTVEGLGTFFGIRDFILGVNNVTQNTNCLQAAADGSCIECNKGFSVGSNCTNCSEGKAISETGLCTTCSIFCKTCPFSSIENPQNICDSCDAPLVYDKDTRQCNDKTNSLYTANVSPLGKKIQNNFWVFYPKIQTRGIDYCGKQLILGSSQLKYRNLKASRTFKNLPPHRGVILHFFFYQIDSYDGQANNKSDYTVKFKLNGKQYPYKTLKQGYNICGNSSLDAKSKIVLNDFAHTAETLTFQIQAERVKFGINSLLLFLSNCPTCNNGVSQELELLPVYSIETPPKKGLKSKISFSDPISLIVKPKDLYAIDIVNKSRLLQQNQNDSGQGTGQLSIDAFTEAKLIEGRELQLFRALVDNQINKKAIARVAYPDRAWSVFPDQDRIKVLNLNPLEQPMPRYDDIPETDNENRVDTRNLRNLFRGISILALFIGLLSFFIGYSHLFDDLFVLCQVIFVHIFIQSPWLPATFKIPLSGMQNVQFMAWLPMEGRKAIENGIYQPGYYQKTPIVYEQYWKDIHFIRAIYHTLIFLAAMLLLYFIAFLLREVLYPRLTQILQSSKRHPGTVKRHYLSMIKHRFVIWDKVMRFAFFTVVWAANLQFIHFGNLPRPLSIGNSVLCIVMFVFFVLFPILGQIYLVRKKSTYNESTFRNKYSGIRINRQRILYYFWQYLKLLIIATLIAQLYKSNPLAVLIPLVIIHILDAVLVAVLKPYIRQEDQQERITGKCSKFYWKYYWISFIIQNILFAILEIIMIIMYGTRSTASTASYFSTGYAGCAFIVMLLINGLIRLGWGIAKQFDRCIEDYHTHEHAVKSEQEVAPLRQIMANKRMIDSPIEDEDMMRRDNSNRRPSIEGRFGM